MIRQWKMTFPQINSLKHYIYSVTSLGDIFPKKYDITAYWNMENDHSRKYDIALNLKTALNPSNIVV